MPFTTAFWDKQRSTCDERKIGAHLHLAQSGKSVYNKSEAAVDKAALVGEPAVPYTCNPL